MAKKATKLNGKLTHYLKTVEGFAVLFPNLSELCQGDHNDFRGITIFIGDRGDWLAGVKRFGPDSGPEILWATGSDVVEALIGAERGITNERWKPDKRYK